jgi:hypothetical protein
MKPTRQGDKAAVGSGHGHHHSPEEMHNDDVAHEHSDINIAALAWSMAVMFGVVIVTAGLMYALFVFLEGQAAARDPHLSPLARPAATMPRSTTESPFFGNAPEPKLMTDEPTYLGDLRKKEQEQLQGSGWVDEAAGVAHIPIDRAKQLTLERLPVRPEPVGDDRLGTRRPASGESSSGRTVTEAAAPAPAQSAPAPAPAPAASAPDAHTGK